MAMAISASGHRPPALTPFLQLDLSCAKV